MPDIDVDFCFVRRDEVIRYVREKYGADHVAQIITFGTLKGKAAIKDVGRVLDFTFAETDRIAKLYPEPKQGKDFPLEQALEMEPRLRELRDGGERERRLFDLALRLEGLLRHASKHAAGIVISERPLTEDVPLWVDKDGAVVTQYSFGDIDAIGLIKFDFLGLKTLTLVESIVRRIREGRGVEVPTDRLPLDDPPTYKLLAAADTIGVFQLESGGIRRMLTQLRQRATAEARLAGEIFDQMQTFAAYGFNKSHSAAYALITYQTAYLKAHYPTEFMAGLLSLEAGDVDSTYKNIAECRARGIAILPPDVNASREDFTAAGDTIRFGLGAVKGVGSKAIEAILAARDEGPFTSLADFCLRVRGQLVNRRVIESLVKCGAFDSIERNRARLLAGLDEVMRWAASRAEERASAQIGLFGGGGGVEVIAWPDTYRRHEAVVQGGAPVVVAGALEISDERCQVIADEVLPLARAHAESIRQVHVRVPLAGVGRDGLAVLKEVLAAHPGPCDAFLHLERGDESETVLALPATLRVTAGGAIVSAVERLLGAGVMSFR